MRKFTNRFVAWCADDSAAARFERTVAQGLVGVAAGMVTYYITGEGAATVVVAPLLMAFLSPIQKAIGEKGNVE